MAAAISRPRSRAHAIQMFPQLTDADIARISRFGTLRRYARGERLFAAGEPGPGMFVVLKGSVVLSQRDGLGHVAPVVSQGPGHFLGEVGSLSGRQALVDAHAEEDVEALLVPPEQLRALIIAEADLGERIIRALILRRVGLIEAGASGPVLIGEPESPELLRLQTFLKRNGYPHQVIDAEHDDAAAALLEQYGAAVGQVLAIFPNGTVLLNPSEESLGRSLGMLDAARAAKALRRRRRRRRARGLAPPSTPPPRACASLCSTADRSADRRARALASRITSAFRPVSPARRSPAAPSCRRRSSVRRY